MPSSKNIVWLAGASLLLLAVYAAISLAFPRGNQSVSTFGDIVQCIAPLLANAGLLAESDQLLKQELPRAVAPYYHMLGLASNAKKRKDTQAALSWYEQAWRKSEGLATRIQWGTGFIGHLVELAPTETARVEAQDGGQGMEFRCRIHRISFPGSPWPHHERSETPRNGLGRVRFCKGPSQAGSHH